MPESTNPPVATSASAWSPLRIPLFRNLLIADFVSDVGAFMQAVGAAWLMTSLSSSPLQIALIQTASALPFFLLALPAGNGTLGVANSATPASFTASGLSAPGVAIGSVSYSLTPTYN